MQIPCSSLRSVVCTFWATSLYKYLNWYTNNLIFNGNRGFSTRVKRPAREADHSLSSFANVKNEWRSIPTYKKYFPFSFHLLRETNHMKTNPSWEADRSSASQRISRSLLSPRINYRFYKSPPLVPVLRQTNLFLASILFLEDPPLYSSI